MKILVSGARGQLGSQIINILKDAKSELGELNPIYKDAKVKGLGKEDLNITDLKSVLAYVNEFKPNLIINTAAYTDVDACESNEEVAFKVNSIGPRNLAIASEKVGSKLVHISTDYVFSGDGKIPYREYDDTKPVSVYGKTKLDGENYVKEFCKKYFIVRTAWLYGNNGNNFVKTILKLAKEKGHLDVVDDQRGNPTNAEDLAYHILKLALTDEYGLYHCTGIGECSWYDFACKIIEYSGINCIVRPINSGILKRNAKRPTYSSLDNMMIRCTIGDGMRNWQDALEAFIKNIEN